MIQFDSKTKIVISDDLKNDLAGLLKTQEVKQAALIIDSNVSGQKMIRETVESLESKFDLSVYSIESREPTTDIVNEYTDKLRGDEFDMMIAIGGGSIIDLTKALSVMVVNEGKVEDYHGTGKVFKSGIKKIMIPTTAGTGSEVTPGAVLVNKKTKFKRAIGGSYVGPDYALLNPSLTLSMPEALIASCGMDALAHAIESYTAKCANDITRMYSAEAFSLIFNNLSEIFKDWQNLILRKKVLLGSCLAGYAIYNSNTGAAHAMAYPLGIYNDIPHGLALAHLLPRVVKVNLSKGCFDYAKLYDFIEGVESVDCKKEKAYRFASILENYSPLSYIDKNFSDYGVNQDNYEFLAERGLDLVSALNNNPVEFGIEDSKKVIREVISRPIKQQDHV